MGIEQLNGARVDTERLKDTLTRINEDVLDKSCYRSNSAMCEAAAANRIAVGKRRYVDWSQPSGLLVGLNVSQVSVNGVAGDANHFSSSLADLISPFRVGQNLSWADKSEVCRIEEQNNVFSLVAGQVHLS